VSKTSKLLVTGVASGATVWTARR